MGLRPTHGMKAHCQGLLIPNGLPRDFRRFLFADNTRTGCFSGSQERLAVPKHKLVLPDPEEESCQYAVSCSSIAGMSRRL